MIGAIIQARVGSSRFPNKIFAEIEGFPLIWHVFNRVKASSFIQKIVVATSVDKKDDSLEEWCVRNNIFVFRGNKENVLERFYFAAKEFNLSIIVRITADDPFKDPKIIDNAIAILINEKLDFVYNNNPPSFPEGLDTEVFKYEALEIAFMNARDPFEKEHVTPYLYSHPDIIKQKNISLGKNLSHLRWTIDYPEDLEMAREVYKYLYKKNPLFEFQDILDLLEERPYIKEINAKVERSAFYKNLKY